MSCPRLLSVIITFLLAAVLVIPGCVTAPRPPSYPPEPNIVFRSTVDTPALPLEPTMAQVHVPRESFVGIRYAPKNTAASTVGDIEVVVEPSKLGVIRTTDFKNEPLLIRPAGLIAWIKVTNQSSHIVDLGQSLLQFEDDKGNEYAIAEGGWTGSTLAFVDSLCENYSREASKLTEQYRQSLEPMLADVRARVAAARRQNDDDLNRYTRFIHERYSPLFTEYVDAVNSYNRSISLGAFSTVEDRKERARELGLPPGRYPSTMRRPADEQFNPERRIVAKQTEKAEADRRLAQVVPAFEAKMTAVTEALRARLRSEIEARRTEWKNAVQSLPLEATKVVQGNGRLSPIVIPPGKHRTVFVPGIRHAAFRDWEPTGSPDRLVLKLYDLPAQTDQAARVVQRSNLEFVLLRETVHVFDDAKTTGTAPTR